MTINEWAQCTISDRSIEQNNNYCHIYCYCTWGVCHWAKFCWLYK